MASFIAETIPEQFPFVIIAIAILLFLLLIMTGRFISLWFQAFVSGTPVPLFNIIGMSLRKIPPRIIINSYINAHKAGLKSITVSDLETHFLAGGHVLDVVSALIAAEKANIKIDWKQATAIDLAGRDVLDAIKTSVNPKVIDCPNSMHGEWIQAVSKNGIRLRCKARVTVRTNIAQLVGGATEETIIARVGEGIISAIGSCDTHLMVLENPQLISKRTLEKGLDAQTAFEILSIDIAYIDVDKNIGAELRAEQAEADKRVAQAKAEESRTMAVALEQQNIAKKREMEAKEIEAKALVPLAIADALRNGNIGVMDYLRMENIRSDTKMRASISDESEGHS